MLSLSGSLTLGLGPHGSGTPAVPAADPDAPVLSNLASGWTAGDNPPDWNTAYDGIYYNGDIGDPGYGEGDQLRIRWTLGAGAEVIEAWVPYSLDLVTNGFQGSYAFYTNGNLDAGGVFTAYVDAVRDLGLPSESNIVASNAWTDTLDDIALPVGVVALGDSQTAAFEAYSDEWALDNPSIPYANLAVGGQMVGDPTLYGTTSLTVWGQADNAIAEAPSIITILTGGNNDAESTYGSGGAQGFYEVVEALADKLKIERPGVKVVVIGILPDGNTLSQNTNRAIVNPLYRAGVGTKFDEYIPLGEHPAFTDAVAIAAAGGATGLAIKTDGVHMSDPPGGQAIAKLLYSAVMDPLIAGTTGSTATFIGAPADQTDVATSTVVEVNQIVTGLAPGTYVAASCDVGTIAINQGSFSTSPGDVKNGDTIVRRLTSSASASTGITQTLTVGAVTDPWTVTTEAASDVTAPTLSSATDAADGDTAMTGSVSTDEGNGTLYWFISTSATPPSATDLKAGTGAVAAGSQAVSGTGVQNISDNGLTAATTYYTHYLHRDAAGNDSSIVSADGFTTDAAAPARVVHINCGDGTAFTGFNSVNEVVGGTGVKIADLLDTTGAATGWGYEVTSAWAGNSNNGAVTSGVSWIPNGVLTWANNQTGSAAWRYTGLVDGKTYDIELMANRNNGTGKMVVFTVQGVAQTPLDAGDNTSNTVVAAGVVPSGGIITVSAATGSPTNGFVYLSATRITEN